MSSPVPIVLWIVGEPGIGKTTLVRGLLPALDAVSLVPKPKWTVGGGVVAAGHYLGQTFDGADTVPYNGVAAALNYWFTQFPACPLTLFDGDRFSHAGVPREFFRPHIAAGRLTSRLACVLVEAPTFVAEERRAGRGSKQNASWVAGRRTKATRFAEQCFDPEERLRLDGRLPSGEQLLQVLDFIQRRRA